MSDPVAAPAIEAANEALAGLRLSMDSPPLESPVPNTYASNGVKGHEDGNQLALVQAELDRTRAEKDALDAQYRSLLEKVTAMRTTLGNKLRQDAEELDRREQLIQSLTAQNEDLSSTVDTLNNELIASNEEAERAARELDTFRARALEDSAYESSMRERDAAELELVRLEKDEWERAALEEKTRTEEFKAQVQSLERDLDVHAAELDVKTKALEREKQTSTNLQSVLEDFQSVKELELQQSIASYESQLRQATTLLAEFKHRAYMAEEQLSSSSTNAQHSLDLEKEVKEKNLLIGKLRHEAVIINEHLTEALRRLRKTSSESSVDRQLVTNVLLQFFAAPRGDHKRYEMLSVLASILAWGDEEREKAGLQRVGSSTIGGGLVGGRRVSSSKSTELAKADETESFSTMWVEYLLKESASSSSNSHPSTNGASSPPTSPSTSSYPHLGERRSSSSIPRSLRVASASSLGMASTPNLLSIPPLSPTPSSTSISSSIGPSPNEHPTRNS